jgi:hypothetical protein
MVFENNVLRKMEGYTMGKVTGNCRKVHEECRTISLKGCGASGANADRP